MKTAENKTEKKAVGDAKDPKDQKDTIFGYHLQFGVAKINEARGKLNLPAVPYGDQTVPEFLASLTTSEAPQPQEEETT
jgi:hypothetical protein